MAGMATLASVELKIAIFIEFCSPAMLRVIPGSITVEMGGKFVCEEYWRTDQPICTEQVHCIQGILW